MGLFDHADAALDRAERMKGVDPAQYAKALHQFYMGAARASVAHAPVMRFLVLQDVAVQRKQLRDHVQHMMEHPGMELDPKARINLVKQGVSGPKVPSMKEFQRMMDMLDDGAAAEARIFSPDISRLWLKKIEMVVDADGKLVPKTEEAKEPTDA